MSRQGIVDAYLNGEISRRTFVRRLVGAGVAFSAATAYAELLRPAWAQAADPDCHFVVDHYAAGHYDGHYECPAPSGGSPQQQPPTQTGQAANQAAVDSTAPSGRFGKLGTLSLS